MLKNLYIKNFILIDSINLQFNDGFSVFTGETGAGKSIFIDGISILTGSKMTTSMIKQGCNKAIIEGEFSLTDEIKEKLNEAGFDDETLIISREINQEGKSSTRVNQRACSVSFIKDLLADYVDIHCQHDNQYLLNNKYHLDLLDKYCSNESLLQQVNYLYKQFIQLQNEYDKLNNTTFSLAQLEIIKYQLDELENANLCNMNEDEEISKQLKEFAALEKNQKIIDQLYDLFESDDGIISKLYQFNKLADNLSNFDSIKEEIHNILDCYYAINDDFDSIKSKMKESVIDENTLNELNERLYLLQRLKRKYNTSLAGLIQLKNQLKQQLQQYDDRELILDQLSKKIEIAKQKEKVKEMFKNFLVTSLVFGVLFLICYRYSTINEAFSELNTLKSDLKKKQTVNAQIELNIKQNTDLASVENYAKYQLGMQKPKDSQVQKINVQKQDKITAPIEIKEEKEIGFFEKIFNSILKVIE